MVYSHVALNCKDQAAVEEFYAKHFGFTRSGAFDIGGGNLIIFIKSGDVYLELFPGAADREGAAPDKDGAASVGMRHLAFQVDNVDAKLAEMGDDAKITAGPMDFDVFIPGWRAVWISDPDGNIVEIGQGYKDQA